MSSIVSSRYIRLVFQERPCNTDLVRFWEVHLPSPWASLETDKVICVLWKMSLLCWASECIQGVICSGQWICILDSDGIQALLIDTEAPCAIFIFEHHHRRCPGAVTNFRYSFFQHLIHMRLNKCWHFGGSVIRMLPDWWSRICVDAVCVCVTVLVFLVRWEQLMQVQPLCICQIATFHIKRQFAWLY